MYLNRKTTSLLNRILIKGCFVIFLQIWKVVKQTTLKVRTEEIKTIRMTKEKQTSDIEDHYWRENA